MVVRVVVVVAVLVGELVCDVVFVVEVMGVDVCELAVVVVVVVVVEVRTELVNVFAVVTDTAVVSNAG